MTRIVFLARFLVFAAGSILILSWNRILEEEGSFPCSLCALLRSSHTMEHFLPPLRLVDKSRYDFFFGLKKEEIKYKKTPTKGGRAPGQWRRRADVGGDASLAVCRKRKRDAH